MRVLHVEDYVVPDLGYQTVNLAKQHALMGHAVRVLASDRAGPFAVYDWVPEQLPNANWHGVRIDRLPVACEVCGRPVLRGLHHYIDRFAPDIVIAHGLITLTSFSIIWRHRRRRTYRLVVDDHMTFAASRRWGRNQFYRIASRGPLESFIKYVDALVAVSEETRQFMIEKYGIPSSRIHVIPLGADQTLFHFDQERGRKLRQHLGIGQDEIVIIYAGKINREKDPTVLIEAFLRVEHQFEKARLLIVGSGDAEYVRRITVLSAQSGRIRLLPGVPNSELPNFYCAADLGCWPRASSLTALEAMACRLPVIVSDQPAAAERVRFGGGLTYREGDVTALVSALTLLLSNDGLRRRMGLDAERAVGQHFSWMALARQFLDVVAL